MERLEITTKAFAVRLLGQRLMQMASHHAYLVHVLIASSADDRAEQEGVLAPLSYPPTTGGGKTNLNC